MMVAKQQQPSSGKQQQQQMMERKTATIINQQKRTAATITGDKAAIEKIATINQKQEIVVKIQKSLMIFSFNEFFSEAVTQIYYAQRAREHS